MRAAADNRVIRLSGRAHGHAFALRVEPDVEVHQVAWLVSPRPGDPMPVVVGPSFIVPGCALQQAAGGGVFEGGRSDHRPPEAIQGAALGGSLLETEPLARNQVA